MRSYSKKIYTEAIFITKKSTPTITVNIVDLSQNKKLFPDYLKTSINDFLKKDTSFIINKPSAKSVYGLFDPYLISIDYGINMFSKDDLKELQKDAINIMKSFKFNGQKSRSLELVENNEKVNSVISETIKILTVYYNNGYYPTMPPDEALAWYSSHHISRPIKSIEDYKKELGFNESIDKNIVNEIYTPYGKLSNGINIEELEYIFPKQIVAFPYSAINKNTKAVHIKAISVKRTEQGQAEQRELNFKAIDGKISEIKLEEPLTKIKGK
jgi:hypothetical protein